MTDLESLLVDFKLLIEIADQEGLDEIANYAQDQALDLEKSIWMIRVTLE
jgi:DNA-binding ferritin-like protein